MSGIADVARRAGVSKSTASRALTGSGYVSAATRQRVREAADALGYVASTHAVSLATGKTQTIGVIVPHVTRWYFGEVVDGIQNALIARDLDCALFSAEPGSLHRQRMFDTYLGRRRFDGLITVGIEPSTRELERITTIGKPLVTIGSYDAGTSAVSINDFDAARRATEHLIGLGHSNIALVGGAAEGSDHSFGDTRRLLGYRTAMAESGLAEFARHIPCEVDMPDGYATAVDFLSSPRTRPTAIVGVCDEVAIGAVIAARRQGLGVPNDLSVIGIDDHAHAEMFSLTTLRQSPRDQGETAVELLTRLIADPTSPPERVWAPATMVIRNSTTVPPESARP